MKKQGKKAVQQNTNKKEPFDFALFPSENPHPIMRVNHKGELEFANASSKSILKAFSCDVGEAISDPWASIFSDAYKNNIQTNVVIESDSRTFEITVVPVKKHHCINLYGRDITKRIIVEKSLLESENRFRFALKNSSVALVIQDKNMKIVWAYNQRSMDPTQAIGKTDYDLFPAEDAAQLVALKKKVIQTGNEVTKQMWLTSGGKRYFLEIFLEPMRDEHGTIIGVGTTSLDLTNIKNTEQALIESEKRFRNLIEYAPTAICEVNFRTNTFLSVNDVMCRLLGYSQDELMHMTPYDIFDDTSKNIFKERSSQWLKGNKPPENVEYVVHAKDGHVIYAVLNTSFTFDENGNPLGAMVVAHDITERKQKEQELYKLNRTLKALSDSNQSMMHAKNETDYLNEVCRIIVDDCGYKMVWIGYAEYDENKTVRPVAHAGFDIGYIETLNITWADTERGRGPTGTAIRTGKIAKCTNMLTDPQFKPWRTEAVKRGYASSLVIPMIKDNKVFGSVTIYSKEPDSFEEKEIQLLSELTQDLTFGITTIRLQNEQEKYKQQLQFTQKLLDAVTEGTEIMISTVDTDLRYTYFNKKHHEQIKRLTGIDTVIGMSIYEVLKDALPQQRDSITELWNRALGGESTIQLTPFGESGIHETIFSTRHTPIRDESGKIIGAGTVIIEVTQQVRMEQLLAKKQEELETIIDSVQASIFYKDKENRFLRVNTSFCEILGMTKEQLEGKSLFEIYPKEQAEEFWQDDKEVMLSAKPKLNILEQINARNKTQWLRTDKIPYRDLSGAIIGVIGFSIDITEQKKAEELLKQDKETIEKLVIEKSSQLLKTQIELNNAKRLADIGALAATVAHELRNPLAAISLASANIKRKAQNPSLDPHLQTIQTKISESDYIIDNLLFYSRIRPPQLETMTIYDLIEESIETTQKRSFKNIRIQKDIEVLKNISFNVDPLQMKEVFSNILHNAYDAVLDTSGHIELTSALTDSFLTIAVKDNGCGIKQEYLDKVFDPFFTTKAKGTGLGLPLCKQIIQMHGGFITITSEENRGSNVSITLPVLNRKL